jgi:methylenetetrahydrofolate reductase (NADPH)
MAFRLSFEFFPPRTEQGQKSLIATARRLARHNPEFFSVTYGAGGSTRDRTFEAVSMIAAAGLPVAPHLSIGTDSEHAIGALLEKYRALGITRIVALRGDVPSGIGSTRHVRYAEELVRLIRAHTGEHFHIEVAAYPEVHPDAPSPVADLEHFKRKVGAGASSAITQYFFNPDAYFDFVARARAAGIGLPIVPGIMPITNYANLVRFSDNCGAEIPRWIRKRLEALQRDEVSLLRFGEDVVTELCTRLIHGGAPGLHFYTLNQARPTEALWRTLAPLAASGNAQGSR